MNQRRPTGWRLATNTNVVMVPPQYGKKGESRDEGIERVTILAGDEEREPSFILALRDKVEDRRHVVTMSVTAVEEMRSVLDEALETLASLLEVERAKKRGAGS